METLMVNCGEGKAEGPGLPLREGAKGRRPLWTLSCAPGACRLGDLVSKEEGGEDRSLGHTTGAENGVWVEMGGIAGALGGGTGWRMGAGGCAREVRALRDVA